MTYETTIERHEVRVLESHIKGKGVYAQKNFNKGEVVIVGKPVSRSVKRTWQTLQMDVNYHVRMDKPFELVNHSCDPNCGIKENDLEGYNLVAMKDINVGEEITFDYCMTEWISIAVSECKCQTDICRKDINGGKFLSAQIMDKYKGYLAPYYEKLINL